MNGEMFENGKIIFDILLAFLGCFIAGCTNGAHWSAAEAAEDIGLYSYSSKEVKNFLTEAGYGDMWTEQGGEVKMHVTRDSKGTELRICNETENKVLVISSSGDLEEKSVPGTPAWLNDNHEVVMWKEMQLGGTGKERRVVHYKDGTSETETTFLSIFPPDPAGLYFKKCQNCQWPQRPTSRRLFWTQNPQKPLAKLNGKWKIMGLRGDKLVIATGETSKPKERVSLVTFPINQDGSLGRIQRRAIHIPKKAGLAWGARKMSPSGNKMLLEDPRDFPSLGSLYYIFDLDTKKLTYIGRAGIAIKRWTFFLQTDILRN